MLIYIFIIIGNYPQMQELHKKYEKDGLSVLAFPCNQVRHFRF